VDEKFAPFDVILACDSKLGIGKNNTLPWKLSGDMKYFRDLTSCTEDPSHHNAIIMGRKTWDSIPAKRKPLPDRINIVLSADSSYEAPEGASLARSLDEALKIASERGAERIFVIGGAQIFARAITHPACNRLYITEIDSTFDCDVFLPDFKSTFTQKSVSERHVENGIEYSFKIFTRV